MTLFDYLKSNPSLEISKRLKIWEKVAEGVREQHEKLVFHFDLKAMNIFVDEEQNDVKEIVIADFGIGKDDFGGVDHHFGTPGVGSPEQFTSNTCEATDIFSLGKLCVQIIFPWNTFWGIIGTPVDQSAIDKFRNAHPIFKKFHDLVSSMLEVNRDTY